MRIATIWLSVGLAFAMTGPIHAETEVEREARELAEIQRLLNAQVLSKPFSVEETTKIDAYIEEATKRKVKPEPYKGTQKWLPGMTCAHLRGYYARRNCRFYYAYYGYYYPYHLY